MRNQRYTLARRILFPYSGKEPLTLRQGLRIILVWALLLPLAMSCCTLLICVMAALSFPKTVFLLLFTFLSGGFIFGILGWVAVSMSNRAAHIRQARKARTGY